MAKLVTAILARNEAGPDRYFRRVLERCWTFSDAVLVLDDGSTDETEEVARHFGARVCSTKRGAPAWGAEAPARAKLWDAAAQLAGPDGWVLVCDADMLLEGDPRPLTLSWDCAAWAWPLIDCWDSESTFRVDGAWAHGPMTPRAWMFRPGALKVAPLWSDRGVHCGHAPANFGQAGPCGIAPPSLYWRHLGWLNREHRRLKAAQYASVDDQLSEFELAHAATILDE